MFYRFVIIVSLFALLCLMMIGCAGGAPQVIGPFAIVTPEAGGSAMSADGNLTLTIPAGAVDQAVTVTVTPLLSPAGEILGYSLSPDGLTLKKPARVSWMVQPFDQIDLELIDPQSPLIGTAYIEHISSDGSLEIIESPISAIDQDNAGIVFDIEHFSSVSQSVDALHYVELKREGEMLLGDIRQFFGVFSIGIFSIIADNCKKVPQTPFCDRNYTFNIKSLSLGISSSSFRFRSIDSRSIGGSDEFDDFEVPIGLENDAEGNIQLSLDGGVDPHLVESSNILELPTIFSHFPQSTDISEHRRVYLDGGSPVVYNLRTGKYISDNNRFEKKERTVGEGVQSKLFYDSFANRRIECVNEQQETVYVFAQLLYDLEITRATDPAVILYSKKDNILVGERPVTCRATSSGSSDGGGVSGGIITTGCEEPSAAAPSNAVGWKIENTDIGHSVGPFHDPDLNSNIKGYPSVEIPDAGTWTGAHPPMCDYTHYHGSVNGIPDPLSGADCGHGCLKYQIFLIN